MPLRPLKQCKKCTTLTRNTDGYCDDHMLSKDDARKQYDTNRDKKYVSFYNSTQWIKLRQVALSRDNGLCQHCLKSGQIATADVVHHMIEVKINWYLRLSLVNLISLCNAHHNLVHKGK